MNCLFCRFLSVVVLYLLNLFTSALSFWYNVSLCSSNCIFWFSCFPSIFFSLVISLTCFVNFLVLVPFIYCVILARSLRMF
jgi:hypothetical protein